MPRCRVPVGRHARLPQHRLFSFATPKKVARTYHRVCDLVGSVFPTPKRIVQDVKRAIHAMKVTYEHRGAFTNFVPGLKGGRVPDHCHAWMTAKTTDKYEDKRTKK